MSERNGNMMSTSMALVLAEAGNNADALLADAAGCSSNNMTTITATAASMKPLNSYVAR